MLLLFLYGLWLAFNARVTPDVALAGLPVAGLLYFFCLRFLGYSPRRDLLLLRALPDICAFLLCLLGEVLRSALRVTGLILSGREPSPRLITFDPVLRTGTGRVLLADAITLTPGTITLEVSPGSFSVHCLDGGATADPAHTSSAERIRRLESVLTVQEKEGSDRKGGGAE